MCYLKSISVVLFGFLVISCAPMELNKTQKNEIRKIGLVVLVNEFTTIEYVGPTIFNNKHYEIKSDASEFIKTISDTAGIYLKKAGYEVKELNISNEIRNEFTPYISKKLESKLTEAAINSGVDTIIVLHDGSCYVAGPPNNFGQTLGVKTSGHGLAKNRNTSVQQYVCLTIDIIKSEGFKGLSQIEAGKNNSYRDIYIIKKIIKKKGKYEFSEIEYKKLKDYYNEQYKHVTEIVLKKSKL